MEEDLNHQTLINLTLNSISVLCGLTVSIVLGYFMIYNRVLVNRVSLRLALAISIIDVSKGITIIIYSFVTFDDFFCSIISFTIQWLTLVNIFLNTVILFNVHLVFVHEYKFSRRLEIIYWLVSFLLPTLFLSPALAFGKLGLDKEINICEYKQRESFETMIWEWASFVIWLIVPCIYSVYITISITVKLFKSREWRYDLTYLSRDSSEGIKTGANVNCNKSIRDLIMRLVLICLIPIITNFPIIAHFIAIYLNYYAPAISILSVICTDIPGILNLALFILDPAFHNIYITLKNKFTEKKNSTELNKTSNQEKPKQPIWLKQFKNLKSYNFGLFKENDLSLVHQNTDLKSNTISTKVPPSMSIVYQNNGLFPSDSILTKDTASTERSERLNQVLANSVNSIENVQKAPVEENSRVNSEEVPSFQSGLDQYEDDQDRSMHVKPGSSDRDNITYCDIFLTDFVRSL